MTKQLTLAGIVFATVALAGLPAPAQTPAADEHRRSEAANEPMQSGDAAGRDAAAIHDAQTGWYADAFTTRDARLAGK